MGALPLAKNQQTGFHESVSTETLVKRAQGGDTRAFEARNWANVPPADTVPPPA